MAFKDSLKSLISYVLSLDDGAKLAAPAGFEPACSGNWACPFDRLQGKLSQARVRVCCLVVVWSAVSTCWTTTRQIGRARLERALGRTDRETEPEAEAVPKERFAVVALLSSRS